MRNGTGESPVTELLHYVWQLIMQALQAILTIAVQNTPARHALDAVEVTGRVILAALAIMTVACLIYVVSALVRLLAWAARWIRGAAR